MQARVLSLYSSVGVATLIAAAQVALVTPAMASDAGVMDRRVTFDIPSQPLDLALLQYSRQSGVQVIASSDVVANKSAPAVYGGETPRRALDALLRNAGLTFSVSGDNTVAIKVAEKSVGNRRSASVVPAAMASPPPPSPAASSETVASPAQPQLQEIVVTATRQSETVNRVPLSMTASTEKMLEQRGIKNVSDLVGDVPALTLSQNTSGVANIAIRGIANATGNGTSPTTGFYLDDTPLQKRNTGSLAGYSNNGTPLPPLFDLQRIEVLRGPQGTLFGGSSMGGTIRYITPPPSLTTYSTLARGDVSHTKDGDVNYEAGVAIGGPIVKDKLGFRVSVWGRHDSGFIDFIDPLTGLERFHNANSQNTKLIRASLLWAPTDRLHLTLAYFGSRLTSASMGSGPTNNGGAFTLPTKEPVVAPTLCFNTSAVTQARPSISPVPVDCNSPGVTYTRPGFTYGPYNLKPYDFLAGYDLSPGKTTISIPTLTADWDAPWFTLKSITSLLSDRTSANYHGTGTQAAAVVDAFYGPAPPSQVFPQGGRFRTGLPAQSSIPTYGIDAGPIFDPSIADNKRDGFVQELRLSSSEGARPLSWVVGAFYSRIKTKTRYRSYESADAISRAFYGISSAQRYGQPDLIDCNLGSCHPIFNTGWQDLRDTERAAFGELNYWLWNRLKLIAGARVARTQFDYDFVGYGPVTGQNQPGPGNGTMQRNSTKETTVTPRFGAQFQIDPNNMVYTTVSKGFRAGGVNPPLAVALCNTGLVPFGLTTADLPQTFEGDSVWSYEGGAKVKAFQGRVQMNASAYQVDWTNVQLATNISGGCGGTFISNVGAARSRGVEFDGTARFGKLLANFSVGYMNAKYTQTSTGPVGAGATATPLVVAIKGQPFPVPRWTLGLGGRYDFGEIGRVRPYARADWRYTSSYVNAYPGTPGYSPDIAKGVATSRVALRAGAEFGDFDLNVYATNVFNNERGNVTGGRAGCTPATGAACTAYASYNPFYTTNWGLPRQVGLQVTYRH